MDNSAQLFENLLIDFLNASLNEHTNEATLAPLRDRLIVAAEKASEAGHIDSIWWLGNNLYFGTWGPVIDSDRGTEMLTRAAHAGHMQAQLDLANIFELEKMDFEAAYKLYDMAAQSGSIMAKIKTIEMSYYGRGVKSSISIKEKAINSLKEVAEKQHSALALYTLATINENNFSLQDKDKIVFNFLEQSHALLSDDPESYLAEAKIYFRLGRYLHEGIGTEQDKTLGLQYIEYASTLEEDDATAYLVQDVSETEAISPLVVNQHAENEEEVSEFSAEDLQAQFSQIVGWEEISQYFDEICNIAVTQQKHSVGDKTLAPHFIVSGPPGSGKDLFIDLIAKNLFLAKYLNSSKVFTIDLADIMTLHLRSWSFSTQEGPLKALERTLKANAGKIIVIKDSRTSDYAGYSPDLHSMEQYYGLVIHQFLKKVGQNTLIVLYEEGQQKGEADRLLRKHHDLDRCFRIRVNFENFSVENLLDIFTQQLQKDGFSLSEEIRPFLISELEARKAQAGTLKVNSHLINDLVFETYRGLAKTKKDQIDLDVFERAAPREEADINTLLAPIDTLIGLDKAKQQMRSLAYRLQAQSLREKNGISQSFLPAPHFVFTGSPGTGKTTVARMLGEILKGMGYLSKGHVVETDGTSLVGKYLGQTAPIVQEKIEQADGGILFIDEAYTLAQNPSMAYQDGYREEAIATLLKFMEDRRGRFVVVAAGYSREMQNFLNTNSGLRSRFNQILDFESFNSNQLITIFENLCKISGYTIDPETKITLGNHLDTFRTVDQIDAFGNARGIRTLYETTMGRQSERILKEDIQDVAGLLTVKSQDLPIFKKIAKEQTAPTSEILRPLTQLVGLDKVKEEVSKLAYLAQAQMVRSQKNLPYLPINLHSLFVGPPGTGKTTVARLFGRILHELGYLEKGHVVEVDKGKLTGQYLGQTAPLVLEQVERADGGILFIDEAYALNDGYITKGFGDEALSTLLKLMEDRRDRFIVIAAGYPKEMEEFLKVNSGLRSRFPNFIEFERYENKILIDIFEALCHENQFVIADGVKEKLSAYMGNMDKSEIDTLGNVRLMRNIFEKTIATQSSRVIKNNLLDERFQIIEQEDLTFPKESKVTKIGF